MNYLIRPLFIQLLQLVLSSYLLFILRLLIKYNNFNTEKLKKYYSEYQSSSLKRKFIEFFKRSH